MQWQHVILNGVLLAKFVLFLQVHYNIAKIHGDVGFTNYAVEKYKHAIE